MRIYKGEAGVDLTLESFLDLLEEDALEDIIDMVLDLEATGSIKGTSFIGDFDGDFDDDVVFLGVINLEDFDGDIDSLFEDEGVGFANLFDFLSEEQGYFDNLSEEDLDLIFGPTSTLGASFPTEEELMENFLCSNEDLKVKRIVQRFRHILDAQK
jgi:hypothetical protein